MTNDTEKAVARMRPARLTCPGFAQQSKDTSLFKIVSVKDEIVIGLSADEMSAMGGNDAGAVAKALASKGSFTRVAICDAQGRERRSRAGAAGRRSG